MSRNRNLYDRPNSFGWISILLHWITAAIIIVMWFLGKSILSQPADEIDARRSLHITLGLVTWLLLAARIVWRFKTPHPHVEGQSDRIHRFARMIHYIMLIVLSAMLLSGPALAWALDNYPAGIALLHGIHSSMSNLLFALVLLHLLGAMKHLMFHDDETLLRMLFPRPD